MGKLLEIAGVFKSYGPLKVLKDVTFSVDEREIFAIIGPNGAGKTTLFKTMTGESMCDAGTITYAGRDITRAPAPERVRMGMGRTFQVARVFKDFTVQENLVVTIESRRRIGGETVGEFWSAAPSAAVVEEAERLMEELGLVNARHREATLLSHGDKKRLEFTIALALRPRILMLDEPTAGMSPRDRINISDLIRDIQQKRGVTIAMTEHDMDIVFGLADRIMVLNYGEITAIGSVEEIRANPAVRDVYLGQEMYHA